MRHEPRKWFVRGELITDEVREFGLNFGWCTMTISVLMSKGIPGLDGTCLRGS